MANHCRQGINVTQGLPFNWSPPNGWSVEDGKILAKKVQVKTFHFLRISSLWIKTTVLTGESFFFSVFFYFLKFLFEECIHAAEQSTPRQPFWLLEGSLFISFSVFFRRVYPRGRTIIFFIFFIFFLEECIHVAEQSTPRGRLVRRSSHIDALTVRLSYSKI